MSVTQHLFYVQWYICQGNMFRPSWSSSGPTRKQIQGLFIFLHCGIPNAYQFELQKQKYISVYKLIYFYTIYFCLYTIYSYRSKSI